MRPRAAVLPAVLAAALVDTGAEGTAVNARTTPVGPPPLAFRSTTLVRDVRAIDVRIQAMTEVPAHVFVVRHGRRLGDARAMIHAGQTAIPVRLTRRAIRRLHAGQHVDVAIFYGRNEPVRVRGAVLLYGTALSA